jgi:hypothetical protein
METCLRNAKGECKVVYRPSNITGKSFFCFLFSFFTLLSFVCADQFPPLSQVFDCSHDKPPLTRQREWGVGHHFPKSPLPCQPHPRLSCVRPFFFLYYFLLIKNYHPVASLPQAGPHLHPRLISHPPSSLGMTCVWACKSAHPTRSSCCAGATKTASWCPVSSPLRLPSSLVCLVCPHLPLSFVVFVHPACASVAGDKKGILPHPCSSSLVPRPPRSLATKRVASLAACGLSFSQFSLSLFLFFFSCPFC